MELKEKILEGMSKNEEMRAAEEDCDWNRNITTIASSKEQNVNFNWKINTEKN